MKHCLLPLLALTGLLSGCAHTVRMFPLAPPMTEDTDRQHVTTTPKDYFSPLLWDGADQIAFRPISRFLAVETPGRSLNVNSLDEVPNSSWFENRIGLGTFTPEMAKQGACDESPLDPNKAPWTVVAAKPNGANPGFIIKDSEGRGYLLKMDGRTEGDRATTADVFGSRVYHAAGFHAPCNKVVFFDPSVLAVDPEAETEDHLGRDRPMTQEDVETVLGKAIQLEDGRLRASASRFLSGRPIGPWTYQGKRRDDPNDVIRHEDRRELRGARILAAWLNHFDAREQNTLDMWVTDPDGTSYIKHHYIDFGDCLGSRWAQDGLSRRFGHSYYLDVADVLLDFVSLGVVVRPWQKVGISEYTPQWGYYDAEHFKPPNWKAGYPNISFNRMLDDDGAWMARILAHFTDEHIAAMLSEAHMGRERDREQITRTLITRRDKLLAWYLQVRSPLADFEVVEGDDGPEVCFTDLAAKTGALDPRRIRYESRMYVGDWETPAWVRHENEAVSPPADGASCVALVEGGVRASASGAGASNDPSRYQILDLLVYPETGSEPIGPARLHFYDTPEGFVLAGVERPADDRPPAKREKGP
ncbi:MAG: hypothetical protein KDA24_07625 [Deltaproteobacteria bacterium]|nr:hypothetical protein [Deltaproteobacteria bacterium]